MQRGQATYFGQATVRLCCLLERHVDVRDQPMLRHVRDQVQVVEKKREIAQLFPALRQPLPVERIDALSDAVVGTEVSGDCAAPAGDDAIDHPLGVGGHGDAVRIISVRRARKEEIALYES